MIRTVRGGVAPEALGHTQCHEHVFLKKGTSFAANPALCMDDYGASLKELLLYRGAGGGAIVDAQPVFAGRMARELARASGESGVHIVASTGFHKLMFYPKQSPVFAMNETELARLFTKEITLGMMDSDGGERLDACAGIVKVAQDECGIGCGKYPALFGAAGAAAAQTGAPVLIHTDKNPDALGILRFFERFGIQPGRLIFSHLDRTRHDAIYHKELLSAGANLCYDSVHRLKYVSHEQEIELICRMLDAGFAGQVLLSLDTTNERLKSYGADIGLDYILQEFIPMLRKAGASGEQIDCMTGANAARVLQIKPHGGTKA